ncbi:MAG: DUF748 domain-containing protein, partial [Candidatus Omnitrophica bacterium]|nr:DUF748 domain-containing protein [Candidatus Omnitrophota bacterium]
MKKKNIFLIAITLLAFFFIAASLYVNNIFLPQKVKPKLIAALEEYFKQNVEIEKLSYGLINGLRIQGLSVYRENGSIKDASLEIKEVSFNLLALPLFNKGVIIPSLNFISPRLYIKRKEDKTFNLPFKPDKKSSQAKKWDVFIAKIRVRDGKVRFNDESIAPTFSKEVSDILINIDFNLKKKAKIYLQARLFNAAEAPTQLVIAGSFVLKKKILQAKINVDNIALGEYAKYLKEIGKAVWLDKPLAKNIIEQASTIKNLSAECELSEDKLRLKKAGLEAMGGNFIFSGLLDNFKNHKLSLNISATGIMLQHLAGLWPDLKEKIKIQGTSDINMNLEAVSDKPIGVKGWANIKNSQASTVYLESPLTNICAKIDFSQDGLNWRNLTFDY